MTDLKTFLENPSASFSNAAALHKKYGRDREIQAFIDKYPEGNPVAHSLLRRELARLYRIAASSPKHETSNFKPETSNFKPETSNLGTPINPIKKKIRIVDTLDIDYSKLSPELQAKYKSIQANFKEMCLLHDQLKHAKTDACTSRSTSEARAPLVEKLKSLEDANTEYWADIYAWADENDAKKELTKGQKNDQFVLGMLKERRQQNLREYIRRESKKLTDEDDATRRSVIEARIAEWRKELACTESDNTE